MSTQRSIVIGGGAFAGLALALALRQGLGPDIPVIELDNNINDEAFAEAVTQQLLTFLSTE